MLDDKCYKNTYPGDDLSMIWRHFALYWEYTLQQRK